MQLNGKRAGRSQEKLKLDTFLPLGIIEESQGLLGGFSVIRLTTTIAIKAVKKPGRSS